MADIKLPSAVALVNERFKRAQSDRVSKQDPIWRRSYNNWRGVLDDTIYPWRSKLFVPWSFTVVETIVPRLYARAPKWRALPATPEYDPDSIRVVQDLLTYQWDKLKMPLKIYDWIKDSLMFSKGFVKVQWDYARRNKTYLEPIAKKDGTVEFKESTKSELEWDDPIVEVVDPFDLYVDPDATSLEDAAYVIHRKTIPLEEVRQNPNYKNTEKIKTGENADPYEDKYPRYDKAVPLRDNYKNLVEVLEYWDKPNDRLVTVANKKVLLRDTAIPFWHKQYPFVELDDYRDPHRFYGQSELSVIDSLQREVNAIRNQRRDYDNLALNPVILGVTGTVRDFNSLVMAPGRIWPVTDINGLAPFQLPLLQGAATEIELQTSGDIQRTTALDEITIGLLPEDNTRRSATEIVTSQNSAGKRFSMKIALLEEAVEKLGELIFALNQQFIDRERVIQVVGERGALRWVEFGPDDIRGSFAINIETGSMAPKDELSQRKEAVELIQYVTPIIAPLIQQSPQILTPLLRMFTDTFEIPGKDEILTEIDKVLGATQQQAAAAQQVEQAQGEADVLSSIADITEQGARADLEANTGE